MKALMAVYLVVEIEGHDSNWEEDDFAREAELCLISNADLDSIEFVEFIEGN